MTNTGDVDFYFTDIQVVDDNDTPDDPSDDISNTTGIVFLMSSDLGGDFILSPGEMWLYEYTTTVGCRQRRRRTLPLRWGDQWAEPASELPARRGIPAASGAPLRTTQ